MQSRTTFRIEKLSKRNLNFKRILQSQLRICFFSICEKAGNNIQRRVVCYTVSGKLIKNSPVDDHKLL